MNAQVAPIQDEMPTTTDMCPISNFGELEEKQNVSQDKAKVRNGRPIRKKKKTIKTEKLDTLQLQYFRKGRQDLPLREKIKIIEMLESAPKIPQRMIASTYKVSQSQISRIQNNRDRIMKEWENGNLERRRNRAGKGGVVEQKLLEWFTEAKNESIITSGPILMEKAKAISEELGLKFTPTSGWFGRWKNRNGITLKGMNNKDGNISYSKLSSHWRRYTFMKIIKNVDPQNIWFLETLDLFHKALPDTLMNSDESLLSNGLSLVLAFNLVGNAKRNPMVVGTEKITSNTLPLPYYTHPEGTITNESFCMWLTTWDKELRVEKRKINLFLCKTKFIPTNFNLFNINLHFFPDGDIKSLKLQPFQFGILKTFKYLYRYQLASHHLSNSKCKKLLLDSSKNGQFSPSKCVLSINIIDRLFMIKRAWRHVSPDILLKGVVKAGLSKRVQVLSVEEDVIPPLGMSKEKFETFVSIDNCIKEKISKSSCFNSQETLSDHQLLFNDSEALLACNLLRKYLQNKNSVYVDQLAEIESDVQWSILSQDFPDSKSISKCNPLFSPTSIHSFQGHEKSLNKRKDTQDLNEKLQNATNKPQDASTRISSHYSSRPIDVNDKHSECNFSRSQEIVVVPSVINESSKNSQPVHHHHDHRHQVQTQIHHEYQQSPSCLSQSVELKGMSLSVPRTISEVNLDRRFGIYADMQHPRSVQEMNAHIIPTGGQLANQQPTFIAFSPHF